MILELTDAAVSSVTQYAKLKTWLHENEYDVPDTTKATVRDLLADEGVQGPVRRVLEIWADSAKASLAKIETMLGVRNSDDVARGLQMFHGASTGRWAGKLIQPHNFPRGEIKDVERFLPLLLAGDRTAIDDEEPVLIVISELLRRMLRARPGRRFMSADFKQIEARVLAWIAEQEDLVQAFFAGGQIYERMAAHIYGKSVDEIGNPSMERHVGKGAVLGCGYQMGGKKFSAQLYKDTGILLEASEKRTDPPGEADLVVSAYRAMNHKIVEFWGQIEAAARLAILKPGRVTRCGRGGMIKFVKRGKFLWCILPSGRPLGYCQPSIERRKTKVGIREQIRYSGLNSITRKWVRTSTYGGKLTENVVQAMARDLMVSGMKRTDAAKYPVVLTVHDEILADVPDNHGSLDEFQSLMRETPKWAKSCPVEVEGWEGERYRK
jgi:DNA polymerase